MTLLLQALVSGIAAGAIYAMIALGFSLVYRTSRVLNLAQGPFAVLGAYFAWSFFHAGLPLAPALIAGVVATGLAAGVAEQTVLRWLYKRPLAVPILATVGIAVVLQSAMQIIWGSLPLSLPTIASVNPWRIRGISFTPLQATILIAGVVVSVALLRFVEITRLGRGMRACAQDPEVIHLFGIDSRRMYFASYVIGGLLAGLAGVLLIPSTGLLPTRGLELSAIGFTAAVLGGLGSLQGAMLGGVLIGIVFNLAAVYIDSSYANGVLYLLMTLVLLVRVRGLLGDDLEAVRQV